MCLPANPRRSGLPVWGALSKSKSSNSIPLEVPSDSMDFLVLRDDSTIFAGERQKKALRGLTQDTLHKS